jgi:hypothetical protein
MSLSEPDSFFSDEGRRMPSKPWNVRGNWDGSPAIVDFLALRMGSALFFRTTARAHSGAFVQKSLN